MFEKKFINYLAQNNIDINSLIARNKEEYAKLEILKNNSIYIDTKTLMPIKIRFLVLQNGDIEMDANYKYEEEKCLLDLNKCINIYECENCKVSTLDLCNFNSIYKHNYIFANKGENK